MANLREDFFRYAFLRLRSPGMQQETAPAWTWLENRGFFREEIENLPAGLLGDPQQIKEELLEAGFSRSEIASSELAADPRLVGRLVGPIRDPGGRIVSFWARRLDEQPPRFLFRGAWKDRVPAFGLDVAEPAVRNGLPLVLVEDLLEALLLQAEGVSNAAAIGGRWSEMSCGRWEQLARLGVDRVAFVSGEFSPPACSPRRGKVAPKVVIVDQGQLRGLPTAGAMIRAIGVASFQVFIESLFTDTVEVDCEETSREKVAEPAIQHADACDKPIRKGREYCELHHCDPLACFCFD